MRTAGDIKDQIKSDINEHDDASYGALIMQAIETAYRFVLGEHNWHCAKALFEPSSALVASQPFVLPSNIDRITAVANYVSSTLDHETYYQDHSDGRMPKHYLNWYYAAPVSAALQTSGAGQVSVLSGETTATLVGDIWNAAVAGEYIKIGKATGLYYISSRDDDTTITLSTAFTGDTQTAASFVVRPPFITKRMSLCDANRNPVYPSALKIHYQQDMPALMTDDDIVPIPNNAAPVYWKAYQIASRRKGWNNVADRLEADYIHALGLAKREDPSSSTDVLKPLPIFRRPLREDMYLRRRFQNG